MGIKKLNVLVVFLGFVTFASAQDTVASGFSAVIVHKDPRFDELAAKQADLNKQYYIRTPRRMSGFRIQAANTQNREMANAIKAELLRRFPEEKSYLLYQAPSFRVRIGNFQKQSDAFRLRKQIAALYPDHGIYIVPDTIEYIPQLDDEGQVN